MQKTHKYSTFLDNLTDDLPEFLSPKHLVELDIFISHEAVLRATKDGSSPPYMQTSPRHIRFPKQGVLEWIKDKLNAS